MASQKLYRNTLKLFSVFQLNCKIRHASTTWKELIRKSLCLPIFRNITEIVKKLIVNMVFGDAVTKIQTFVWIFKHCVRVFFSSQLRKYFAFATNSCNNSTSQQTLFWIKQLIRWQITTVGNSQSSEQSPEGD